MSLVAAIREALGTRSAEPDGIPLADGSQKKTKNTEDILEALSAIKTQLEIQNQKLDFLVQSSANPQNPELPPRDGDWSDEVCENWCQLRYPSQARLKQVREIFTPTLQAWKRCFFYLSAQSINSIQEGSDRSSSTRHGTPKPANAEGKEHP
jgi:hypothetical protein